MDEEVRPEISQTRQSLVRRLLRGAFPEAVGLGLVGLIAIAVVACALLAQEVLTDQQQEMRRAAAESAARAVAARLTGLNQSNEAVDPDVIAKIAEDTSTSSIRWLDSSGADRCGWSRGVSDDGGQTASATTSATAPVVGPNGQPDGTVTVQVPAESGVGFKRALFGMCAAVLAATLIVYLLLYRFARRQARPISAIQTGLEDYASGVERELQTLHLSGAFGQVALGWNQLIEETVNLKRNLSQADSSTTGDALSRFESRNLRDMLERLPLGVVRFGADEQVQYANQSAARFLGTLPNTLPGTSVRDALGDDGETLLGAGRRGARAAVDWERKGPRGTSTLRVELLPPREGVDPESLLLIQDVTDLREVEQARNSFLYHVTHELRTPLTNIQAYAETLSRLKFDDEQTRRECYNVIVGETKRLSDLVEDILSISQMEVGAMRLDTGDVDLVRMLRTVVRDNLGAADEKHVELTLGLPPKLPVIQGDKRRLTVLLTNLIGNAVKYTQSGGHVSVRASHDDRRMRIQVTDTGLGIAPDDCEKVFDKFYRVEREEVQGSKGTGLGLAIAREVARLHGGDILLESELGQGSTFTLELPLQTRDAS